MKKLKVIHLSANSSGGAFVAANRFSSALNESGNVDSSHLVFSGKMGAGYRLWANTFIKQKQAFLNHAIEKFEFLFHEQSPEIRFQFSHASTGIDILKLEEVKNADVIHLHWINKGFISLNGLEDLYNSGKKIIWTAHDLWPFTGGCYHPKGCDYFGTGCGNCKYIKNQKLKDLSRSVFEHKLRIYQKYKPTIVVPGYWAYSQAKKSLLSPYIDLHQISHFIDKDVFLPAAKESGQKFRLLFSSINLLDRAKGLIDLAEIIKQMPESYRNRLDLTLIGHAKSEIPEIPCDIRKIGIVDSPEDMVFHYQNADAVISPSYEETFGLVVTEAQSCGIPVLAYSSGELAFNINDGNTGYLSPRGNIGHLKNSLMQLMDKNENEFKRLADNAREFASTKFCKQMAVRKYEELYYKL
jgi:glycosyltransferase involved in cell wall biosynthesis